MKITLTRTQLIIAIIVLLGILLMGWELFRSWHLTRTYGPELSEAILRYVKTLGTIEGRRDPSVMAQVTTGMSLEYLIQFRCVECFAVSVITEVDVKVLQVLEYSSTASEIIAEIEEGRYIVSPNTGVAHGRCYARAYSRHFVLLQEQGVWKVSDIRDTTYSSIEDTPELLAKYCSTN